MNPAPIQRLSHDLLLAIFEYNADMFVDPAALDISLKTSQVCLSWRTAMLEASWIWGRLIDLDSICEMNTPTPWFDELVARTGSAMLWIKMTEGITRKTDADKVDRFLFDLLAKSWSRVQQLCVAVNASTLDPYSSPRWNWLYLPAPYLEVLKVEFGDDCPIPDSSLPPLFAGQAPALRQFRAKHWPTDTRVPWTSSLLSLFTGSPLNLPQLMTVLQKSTGLMMLHIHDIADHATLPTDFPMVSLRKLGSLGIIGNVTFLNCAQILEHIDISPGCFFTYYPLGYTTLTRNFSDANFARLVRALSTLARRIFGVYQPKQICLYSQRDTISLKNHKTMDFSQFAIMLPCGDENIQLPTSSGTAEIFFTAFSLSEFSTVTSLRISLPAHVPLPALATFFACFGAVEELSTDDAGIECVLAVQNSISAPGGGPLVLFPKLKTIYRAENEIYQLITQRAIDSTAVDTFVEERQKAGMSVEVLKIVGEDHIWSRYML